jgi:UDPglucose 6-dehydrogenase
MKRMPSPERRIAIIGAGHVGLVTAACFAKLGHRVICMDVDTARIDRLERGEMPFFEPGLSDLIDAGRNSGRLSFTSSLVNALHNAQFAFIAVGTPTTIGGLPDLSNVRAAGRAIAEAGLPDGAILVSKSTGPVGISQALEHLREVDGFRPPLVANPEFLREGTAVLDFLEPDRVVLGSDDMKAATAVGELYETLGKPIVYTDMKSAEMVKYACNAFLATKISFINEIAEICERVGADVRDVARGMGLDHRIGRSFLNAGVGFGGSCLPKDVKALAYLAAVYGSHPQLLNAVLEINAEQRRRLVGRLRDALGSLRHRRIALFGLAFKPDTDDVRDAPAQDLIGLLAYEEAEIVACDPVAIENMRELFPNLQYEGDPYEAALGCDAVVIATEWTEFRNLDLARLHKAMRTPVIVDGRNALDGEAIRANGFVYFGVGVPDGGRAAAATMVAV